MPHFQLSAAETHFLFSYLGIQLSSDSPLSVIRQFRPTRISLEALLQKKILIYENEKVRLNLAVLEAVYATCDPDEVFELAVVSKQNQTGFTLCRKNDLCVQLEVAADGTCLFCLPIERDRMLSSVFHSFSGTESLPEPLGISFDCSAASAFVLGTLIRHFGNRPHSVAEAKSAIIRDLAKPEIHSALLAASGESTATLLREQPSTFFNELHSLTQKDLIQQSETNLQVNPDIVRLLEPELTAQVAIRRTDVKRASCDSIQALRLGERIVLMYEHTQNTPIPIQHWEEIGRETLRTAALAVFGGIEQAADGTESHLADLS